MSPDLTTRGTYPSIIVKRRNIVTDHSAKTATGTQVGFYLRREQLHISTVTARGKKDEQGERHDKSTQIY